jgi:carbon monoxide dehydrogenase subunit G
MKIEGTAQVGAPRVRVYQCLTDPGVMQRCIPGCEGLEKTAHYRILVDGKGGPGFFKNISRGWTQKNADQGRKMSFSITTNPNPRLSALIRG